MLEIDNEDEQYSGVCPSDGRYVERIGVFALDEPIEIDGGHAPEVLTIEMFKSEYDDQIAAAH